MPDLPIVSTSVDGAWLVYTVEGAEKPTYLPLTKFKVKFALNQIPSADVMPAIGFNLRKPSDVTSITGLRENMQVKVVLSLNTVRTTLLEGFVQTIALTDKSTAFSRKASALVVVKHNIIRLAGAPPVSFAYTAEHAPPLQTLYMFRKTQLMIKVPGGKAAPDVFPNSAFIRQVVNKFGAAAGWYPSALLGFITDSIADEWDLKKGMESPDDLVRSYEPANAQPLGIANIPIQQHMAKTFSQNFPNTNAWEALRRTAKQMFLDIVPFNRGVYISNTNSLLREPDIRITAGEYVEVSDTDVLSNAEPVDGIAVLNPKIRVGNVLAGSVMATWPKVEGDLTEKGRYYHFREFPSWLADLTAAVYGNTNSKPVNEQTPGTAETDKKPSLTDENYLNLAERIAKAFYAHARMSKKTLALQLPFRKDLMPGTLIQIEKPPQRQDFFISDDVYGHITATTFEGDLLSNHGSLTTTITVGSARTGEDNAADNLALDLHPIYQGRWTHIDLEGNFLAELPEHDPMPAFSAEAFNSTTGVKQE